ncbi:MAG: Fe-S cluster assembly protein SufD [Deltaproteobacteria bacterium]|nr:Fe-S cluster assembly protein SufD [Deltaproteobacteria bacterium]
MEARAYVEQAFGELKRSVAGVEPPWVGEQRERAMARFGELGFPTVKDEEWKYTSVAPITRHRYVARDEQAASAVTAEQLAPWVLPACPVLVLVGGVPAWSLSRLSDLPAGVEVRSLGQALLGKEPHPTTEELGRHASFAQQAFVALNTALMQDGALVYVAPGVVLERPIQILHVATGEAAPTASHPRQLVVVERGAQVKLVESYLSFGAAPSWTNVVSEVVVREGASVEHHKVLCEGATALHVATLQVSLARAARFVSHSFSFGGGLVRNDLQVRLDGAGAECSLNGLYLAGGEQHVDNHTRIDHGQPSCTSHELYKGILGGGAKGVFNGKIYVWPGAQKTDAKQRNMNLLLSEEAQIYTKPQLEIFADDVRCTHGATVGHLDEEQLFYLRARAVGEAEARRMLVAAFAQELVDAVRLPALRSQLEGCLHAGLLES